MISIRPGRYSDRGHIGTWTCTQRESLGTNFLVASHFLTLNAETGFLQLKSQFGDIGDCMRSRDGSMHTLVAPAPFFGLTLPYLFTYLNGGPDPKHGLLNTGTK